MRALRLTYDLPLFGFDHGQCCILKSEELPGTGNGLSRPIICILWIKFL